MFYLGVDDADGGNIMYVTQKGVSSCLEWCLKSQNKKKVWELNWMQGYLPRQHEQQKRREKGDRKGNEAYSSQEEQFMDGMVWWGEHEIKREARPPYKPSNIVFLYE